MKCVLLFLLLTTVGFAQHVEVSQQNRTISVSADQTIKVAAELAKLSIGRIDYAPAQEDAFRETKNSMAKVVRALQSLGVKDEQISTQRLSVKENSFESGDSAELRRTHKFQSQQMVEVVVPVRTAQTVVDACVLAGANEVESPDWLLADYDSAQAQAAGAALKKARLTAERMAAGLGAKLGDLVYASNNAPGPLFARFGLITNAEVQTTTAGLSSGVKSEPQLKLFPEPVEIKATVYATFAIQ